ncbi:MAG: hypothetical protein H7A26_05315 [Spirochaetales bacterium]|nr:hypothetical protein [Spirochaetales bacterium]
MREFKYNRLLIKIYLWLSFAAAGALLLSFFFPEKKIAVVLFIPMFLYFIYRNMTVLKTFEDRCEIRIAPFQSILNVNYSEILKIYCEKNLLIILLDNGKKIKVSMSSFNASDRNEVLEILNKQSKEK